MEITAKKRRKSFSYNTLRGLATLGVFFPWTVMVYLCPGCVLCSRIFYREKAENSDNPNKVLRVIGWWWDACLHNRVYTLPCG